ncbi:hypothetical protein, partial [Yersinia entomophaga]|uniref:hypothetical protein n=1 Tax=Yersinia entomophaga TaxID=935293 RepID=UPI0039EFE742
CSCAAKCIVNSLIFIGGFSVSKHITVLLQHGKIDYIEVSDDTTSVTYSAKNGASPLLSMPIEELVIDGKTYYFARSSSLTEEEKIIAAIKGAKS